MTNFITIMNVLYLQMLGFKTVQYGWNTTMIHQTHTAQHGLATNTKKDTIKVTSALIPNLEQTK
jgi:hypothetical protein